jgi:hypothetical protein
MRDLTIVVATFFYVVAIFWAYMNRDSEKVVTALFLGVTALIGSLFAVTFFGSQPPIRKVFSTPIMIDAKTRLPFEHLPFSALDMFSMIQAREKIKAHPELIPDDNTDAFAHTLYHHLLQRAIIIWLEEKYPKTWEVDVFPLTLGESPGYVFQSKQVPSRLFTSSELETKMKGNLFSDMRGPFGLTNDFGLAVPKGTDVTISAPHKDPVLGEISSIVIHNRYCTINIETRASMFGVGAGSYRMFLGMDQAQAQEAIITDQYSVMISITFSPFLVGNPDMPKYKTWASDIANGLEAQFDERAMWGKSKEWLLLHHGPVP